MRIIHFIGTNFVGGPEKQILNHATRLVGTEHAVALVSFAEPGGYALQKEAQRLGIDCQLLPPGALSVRHVYWQLHSIYQNWRPSLICAHGYKAGFYCFLLKLRTGTKYVGFSRGWTGENLKVSIYELIDRLVIRFADRIVAVSEAQATRLESAFVPRSRITVIANAVTIEEGDTISTNAPTDIKKEIGLKPTSRLLLTAGRLSPEKGHTYLIKAMPAVLDDFPDAHLLIAGDGPLRNKLEKQVNSLPHANHVHFLGFRNDIGILFRQADILVLPSLSEGLPNVLLEAMALGVPVVATRVGGVPELVQHENTGLLVEPRQPQQIAQAVTRLLRTYTEAKLMADHALNFVRRHYSAGHQTKKLVELYKQVARA